VAQWRRRGYHRRSWRRQWLSGESGGLSSLSSGVSAALMAISGVFLAMAAYISMSKIKRRLKTRGIENGGEIMA
jgi:hypothetical protein